MITSVFTHCRYSTDERVTYVMCVRYVRGLEQISPVLASLTPTFLFSLPHAHSPLGDLIV